MPDLFIIKPVGGLICLFSEHLIKYLANRSDKTTYVKKFVFSVLQQAFNCRLCSPWETVKGDWKFGELKNKHTNKNSVNKSFMPYFLSLKGNTPSSSKIISHHFNKDSEK